MSEPGEMCSWCQRGFAAHWTFWTQKPDGSGQAYMYCMCSKCWGKGVLDWYVKHELTRDEWLLARMLHG